MTDHIATRETILASLRAELVGPDPQGEPFACSGDIRFDTIKEAFLPRHQKATGEEILQRDAPSQRYGIGVLYPEDASMNGEPSEALPSQASTRVPEDAEDAEASSSAVLAEEALSDLERSAKRSVRDEGVSDEDGPDELDLTGANTYKQSAMAVSFLTELVPTARLVVKVRAGRYRRKLIGVGVATRNWWLRTECEGDVHIDGAQLLGNENRRASQKLHGPTFDQLDVMVDVFSRPHDSGGRLVTVCLINRSTAPRSVDERTLFQVGFSAEILTESGDANIMPYPELSTADDEEEESIALLYRSVQTFGVGHGCAAEWEISQVDERARLVRAEPFPSTETPTITPELVHPETGEPLEIPMLPLSGIEPGDNGLAKLEAMVKLYENWVADRTKEIPDLPDRYREAGRRHLAQCSRAAQRMRTGLDYLLSNDRALRAFQLANHAILLQQANGARKPRRASIDPQNRKTVFGGSSGVPDLAHLSPSQGKWRPFQIAFILMCVRSAVDGTAPDRETVELIWFPTGGGKTEAYLGLAAYSIFYRRLKDPKDSGTAVLMRYTLRLLTAQQFQRAARLVCAMDYLRKANIPRLGVAPIAIGIWLGGSSTPNTRKEAIGILSKLGKGDRFTKNKFLVDQCPWCRAQLGPVSESGENAPAGSGRSGRRNGYSKTGRRHRVLGYEQRANTIVLYCPDATCPFSSELPVRVIDEDIYESPPEFVIGTVDKFAVLAWKDEARALFGIARDGSRGSSPPGLIIQDELHLISGPLGSLVGLYEVLVEELCTDRRAAIPVPPKIVCSTATIRRYRDQVKALYDRADTALFPPPGLDAGHAFFARYAKSRDGSLARGRLYVGVHAPGLGSLQTAQVRTISALLQAPQPLDADARDPWWTLLLFFNSLRELGSTLSLIQSDIPDHLRVLKNRFGLEWAGVRQLRRIEELTSRLQSEEVPEAIRKLEVETADINLAVDICLASSIIEVGIDIDRLSLMAVVGQPKTTAQYIQVTGRVGRRTWDRPGLVVTIYSASKARDRSHFEKFRGYHERLYAQVEPTSVTPFSRPVLERALHAVMVAYARQTSDVRVDGGPSPYPDRALANWRQLLVKRVESVDPAEGRHLDELFERRERQWRSWQPRMWGSGVGGADGTLLRAAGSFSDPVAAQRSWPTPTSLRNVDAECQATISALYDGRTE